MEDKDDARYYEQHENDETWAESEHDPPQDRSRYTSTITVRFSPSEAEGIRRIAKASDATYSDVVRAAVRSFTQPRMTITQTTQNQFWAAGPRTAVAAMETHAVVLTNQDPAMPATSSLASHKGR